MTYTIELSQEEDRLLRLRASESGKSAAELIVAAISHDNHRARQFAERRKELAENFRQLGVSDDDLAEELEDIKHQTLAIRRKSVSVWCY